MLSFIPINMTCTRVSSRRSVTKPSRNKHAKPTTSSASTTRCGNASRASSATPYPSPRRWSTTSGPSSSLFATTTWRKRQHYLCSTTRGQGVLGGRGEELVEAADEPQQRRRIHDGASERRVGRGRFRRLRGRGAGRRVAGAAAGTALAPSPPAPCAGERRLRPL